jgi:hypothetical protein
MRSLLPTVVAAAFLSCGVQTTGVPDGGPPAADHSDIDDFVVQPPPDSGTPPPPRDGGQAVFNDAGVYASMPTLGRVFCADTTCDVTASQQCCIDPPTSGPMCAPSCTGLVGFACDGPEDCPTGARCALTPQPTADGGYVIRSVCAPPSAPAPYTVCHSHLDCPSQASACCRGNFPLGRCFPPEAAEAGDHCDI